MRLLDSQNHDLSWFFRTKLMLFWKDQKEMSALSSFQVKSAQANRVRIDLVPLVLNSIGSMGQSKSWPNLPIKLGISSAARCTRTKENRNLSWFLLFVCFTFGQPKQMFWSFPKAYWGCHLGGYLVDRGLSSVLNALLPFFLSFFHKSLLGALETILHISVHLSQSHNVDCYYSVKKRKKIYHDIRHSMIAGSSISVHLMLWTSDLWQISKIVDLVWVEWGAYVL